MRLFRIFVVLTLLTLLPFLIWGERFTRLFDGAAARQFVQDCGAWGGVAVDRPADQRPLSSRSRNWRDVSSRLRLWAVVGRRVIRARFVSLGNVAFGLCRAFGQRAAVRLAGRGDSLKTRRSFGARVPG
jgi:hypothetical protein